MLACIHTHRLLPRHYFPFSAPNPFKALFHITLLRLFEKEAARMERSGALILRMGLTVTSGGLTNHDRKKGQPIFCDCGN